MSKKEVSLWKANPSQILNIWWYLMVIPFLISILFFPIVAVLIPIFVVVIVWNYLVVKTIQYEITSERLIINTGVINKSINDLELYRVKDTRLESPWFFRMLGLGKIVILTSDLSHPLVIIKAINNAKDVRELLRSAVETRRKERGVSSLDVI